MSGVRIYAAGETSIHAWMESAFAWDACSVLDLKRGAMPCIKRILLRVADISVQFVQRYFFDEQYFFTLLSAVAWFTVDLQNCDTPISSKI